MKKFLVVMLALAMVFGLATTALADEPIATFSDLGDQPFEAVSAIQKLAVLGVLTGDDGLGGAYRPNDTLTRAEFTKIVCFLAAIADEDAESDASQGKFSDVTPSNWFNGYVNAATAAGYFQGTSATTFSPQADITIGEIVTVALRVAGYDDNLPGDWPYNYYNKAKNIGVLDDITGNAGDVATRAQAAIIAEAVLDIAMVVYVGDNDYAYGTLVGQGAADADGYAEQAYDSNVNNKGDQQTILDRAFDGITREVRFAGTPDDIDADQAAGTYVTAMDEIAAWTIVDFEDMDIDLIYEDYDGIDGLMTTGANPQPVAVPAELADFYYIASEEGYSFADLAYLEAEVLNLDGEIAFIEVTSTYELADEIFEDGSNRVDVDGASRRQADTVKEFGFGYYGATMNGNDVDYTADFAAFDDDADDADGEDTFAGKVYYNSDGEVYAVKSYEQYEDAAFGLFEAFDGDDAEFVESTSVEFDKSDDHVLYIDGVMADAEDLEMGMALYEAGTAGADVYLAMSPMVGELTNQKAAASGTLTIDGIEYPAFGNEVLFSTDGGENYDPQDLNERLSSESFGDATYLPGYYFYDLIAVIAGAGTPDLYGVVEDLAYDRDIANAISFDDITIINAEGEEVTYALDSDLADALAVVHNNGAAITEDQAVALGVAVYDAAGQYQAVASLTAAKEVYDRTGANLPAGVPATADVIADVQANGPIQAGDVVKLSTNSDDEVDGIEFFRMMMDEGAGVIAPAASEYAVTVNSSNERISYSGLAAGSEYFASNAIIFNVTLNDAGTEYDSTSVISVESLLSSDFDASQLVVVDRVGGDVTATTEDVLCFYYVGDAVANSLGIITDEDFTGSGDRVAINGSDLMAAADDYSANMHDLVVYGMNADGEVDVDTTAAANIAIANGNAVANDAIIKQYVDDEYEYINVTLNAVGGKVWDNDRMNVSNVEAILGSSLATKTIIDVDDAAYIYNAIPGEQDELKLSDLDKHAGAKAAVVVDSELNAMYVIVYQAAGTSSNKAITSFPAAFGTVNGTDIEVAIVAQTVGQLRVALETATVGDAADEASFVINTAADALIADDAAGNATALAAGMKVVVTAKDGSTQTYAIKDTNVAVVFGADIATTTNGLIATLTSLDGEAIAVNSTIKLAPGTYNLVVTLSGTINAGASVSVDGDANALTEADGDMTQGAVPAAPGNTLTFSVTVPAAGFAAYSEPTVVNP